MVLAEKSNFNSFTSERLKERQCMYQNDGEQNMPKGNEACYF